MRFILIIFLLTGFTNNSISQGEIITSCPDNFDHILCEDWLNNLFMASDAWCTNSGGTTEYEIGYYISPSYVDQVFYYEKLFCCDTEGIDPCEYRFYNCSGSLVETYTPESFGPFGGPAMLETEYFQEFGSNTGGVNVPSDDLISLFIEDLNNFPNCDNINISDERDFCLINPTYIVTQDISYICGVDGNIYENSSIASNCYGITNATDPMDCNFICDNGSVEAGEEEDGCGGDFCPSCDAASCSNPDTTLCQTWLSSLIYSSTCDFSDPQNYNFFKIYTVPYQGDTLVLFYKEQFIISDGSNELTLYSCAGDTLYECSQGIFGTCNDLNADPVFGPLINDTVLIYDCRIDQLDCPDNNPFTTVQTITVDQNSTGLLPSYSGCDVISSNNLYLTTESVFTFMLFDNLDFPMNTNLSVDIFSNGSLVTSTTFQDTVLASTSCVWGWWDAGLFSVGDYEVRHYVDNTFTGLKYLVGESNFSVVESISTTPCASTTDSILCFDWLNQIISNTSFCIDPGSSAITFKVYTTTHNGAPAILVDENINCINPTAFGAGFTLYECNGFEIESCAYQGFETCSNPPLDNSIIGPAYTAATLIYDSEVDALPNCGTQRPFITTWNTNNTGTSCSSCITIPTFSGETYNYDVDWDNDGTYDEFGLTADITHDFGNSGTYTIAIRGDFPRIYFNGQGDNQKIINIDQWGDIEWTSMGNAFSECTNMQSNASDVPDLKFVTDMSRMFSSAESFNQDLSLWDVSNVTDMTGVFQSAFAFNGDVSQWDVSNVTNMRGLFNSADNFNRDLSTWNVSNVTDMSFMFSGATNFDQDISSWNVSSASNMDQMFRSTDNFNQDISSWDVGNVTSMRFMFWSASVFNQDLSSWDVRNVTDMSYMFLSASDFNQDLSLWDVSSVADMSWMFRSAENFSQDISSWDVRNVTDMTGMFKEAVAFNLSLENWEITALSEFDEMLDDSGIDCNNYSSTLIGWAANNNIPNNLILGAQGMEYGANAVSSRNQLVAKGWTINGDTEGSCGSISACASTTDSILCYDWLNQIINNTSFCIDPGSSAITFKVYTTTHNGAPAILVDENINCINPTAFGAGFTLYECNGFEIESCSYQGFETCSNPPTDNAIIGPAYSTATLIYDSEIDELPNCSSQRPFITTWKTDNPGTVCSACVTIPTFSGETYNYDVDWDNDGVFDEFGITGDVTHTYSTLGIYTIGIQGTFPRIYFNNDGDHEKIISIDQWGDIEWTSMSGAFDGCINLSSNASDNPDLSNVTDMSSMFNRASIFNHDIGDWDVSNVTDMNSMFAFASNFDQNLSNWDVSKVTDISVMFFAATNFNGDISGWDVSSVTDMSWMFNSALNFNQQIGNWNVSNVMDMQNMFDGAESFNQNLNNWNVSNVTDMRNMFFGANNFNGIISNWNVSNVTDMRAMFGSASNFAQDISLWNVSNVTDMRQMFDNAISFNSNLNSWDVSSVTDMISMFANTNSFNQDIGNWNVSSVNAMGSMFKDALAFDQDISGWDMSDVNSLGRMFNNATSFDQNLGSWELKSNVTFTINGNGIFENAGLSCENYSNTLIGWANNANTPDDKDLGPLTGMEYGDNAISARDQLLAKGWTIVGDIQGVCGTVEDCSSDIDSILCYDWLNQIISNTSFCTDPGPSAITFKVYTTTHNGAPAILVDNYINCINPTAFGAAFTLYECNGFQIESCSYQGFETCNNPPTDNAIIGPAFSAATLIYDSEVDVLPDCNTQRPFITTWKTDNDGTSCSTCITIPTTGSGYNYDVDWDNDGIYDEFGFTSDAVHSFSTAGTYTIAIRGDFPRIFFGNNGDRLKIINIDQWGDIEWISMESAFLGCENLNSNAIDSPDLSSVTNMLNMFRSASSFNHKLDNWDVSNVTRMSFMFAWATSFNQPLNSWNVSNVTAMNNMFANATVFNQPLNNWDVGNVDNMGSMFSNAESFNQSIENWNVQNVSDMGFMFRDAAAFNQNLASLDLSSISEINNMLGNSGIDCENYSSTLIGWAANNNTPDNLTLGAQGMEYGSTANSARDQLIAKGWTINGDTEGNCLNEERPFITTWKTDNPGTSCSSCITIPTFPGQFYSYDVDWDNDGVYDEFGLNGDATHDYQTAGTYTVSIRSNFPRIYFNGGGDKEKIINIDQWGDISWSSMEYAFAGCTNLNSNATDVPDLSSVLSLSNMFSSAQVFNGDLSNWDVSNITDMSGMFQLAFAFNGDLSQWDVSNVRDMRIMFSSLTDFNSDLSNWEVGDVTNMSGMFQNTEAFNSDLSAWDVNNVTSMSFMFSNAIGFNQTLGSWDLSAVNSLTFMLNSSALECENYTNTLKGWAANPITPSSLELGAQNIEYGNEALNARDSLINILGWTINGDVNLGKDCSECGPGSCLLDNPPIWMDTSSVPDITISCASDLPLLLLLPYSNGQSGDCLIEGEIEPARDESNFDGCSGTIIETWNYTTICGVDIEPYTRTITVSPQGNLTFDITPDASVTISCDDIDLYDISLDYMLDQGDNCIPAGSVNPIITNNYDACGGTVTFIWTVDESCYGSIEFTQTANILPNDNYQFIDLPKDLIIECDDLPFLPDTLIVSNGIEGNCAASEQVIAISIPSSQDCPGTITNTWVYKNPCTSDELTHIQTISLVDCAPPVLEEDYIEVRAGNIYNLNLFDNDALPDSFSARIFEIQNEELFTSSRLDEDGYFEFEMNEAFFDTLNVTYEVCNLACDICTTGFLKIVDEALKDIFLTDIITPDGDGMNDVLKFNFEEEINTVQLFIYNRWGSKIYEKLSYTNDWDASGLPGGIYYYVLKVGEAEVKKTLTVVK